MTTTPPEAPPGPGPQEGPRTTRDEVRDLGRLRRSTTDRRIAGVAGGLGRHLDVDPLLVRVALVVLVFFGGAGLMIYGACWLLVPEDDGSEPAFGLDERTRTVALVIVGVLGLLLDPCCGGGQRVGVGEHRHVRLDALVRGKSAGREVGGREVVDGLDPALRTGAVIIGIPRC